MIKLIKSTFYNEEETKKKLVDFIMKAEILSMSNQCNLFEKKFSEKQNRKYSVFVNSGSSANLLLIQSLINMGRLKKGDIVAVSSLTWATNIMPLIQLGLQPLLVDCEIDTLNVSSKTFKDTFKIQPNIKCVFITNTLGFSDNISEIKNFCEKNNIILLEDNCESLGSITNGKLLGNFGLASTFSFFVGHHLSTIEGGMICTNDEDLYHSLIISRSHGWDRHLPKSVQENLRKNHDISEFYSKYTFYDLAYNVRPTEINGFLGNEQIKYWDKIVDRRYKNFLEINEIIKSNEDLISIDYKHMNKVSNFAIPVIVREESKLKLYIDRFKENDVEIRPMIAGNMARQPFFRKYISNSGNQPNAKFIHDHSFYFGNNPELTNKELSLLANLLES